MKFKPIKDLGLKLSIDYVKGEELEIKLYPPPLTVILPNWKAVHKHIKGLEVWGGDHPEEGANDVEISEYILKLIENKYGKTLDKRP